MPGQHANRLLGWHPPAELSAWVRAQSKARGVPISQVLNEAIRAAMDTDNGRERDRGEGD